MKEASQEITICLAILSARAASGEQPTCGDLAEIERRLERALAVFRMPVGQRAYGFPPEAFA